ncbi:MAG: NapC/NirT family cytochrome c [Calditrichota bacterium]|jgi:nitrate/TMAO reductase-like tetraheme cytochrome c subunit
MKFKLPPSSQNWISLIGATIAIISLFMIIFLFSVTVVLEQRAAYLGLVIYILLPAVMIVGLILIPLGMILKIRREHKTGEQERTIWPRIDLNNLQHRNAFFVFSIGTSVFLFLSAIGSYEAFHFTESNTFCGTLCHSVMHPEYIAYQHSPHAKVGCVDCHVGPGADWYVRSKLSGLYQVYATLANVYPRPIPTPISNLRPARAVCEQCHWPQKFYAYSIHYQTHYLSDKENTPWNIRLILKIGAEHPALGLMEGIHWHINPHVRVEYIATDKSREKLAWIRFINLETGEVKIFEDENNKLSQAQLDTLQVRTMDCIDCHNCPSHLFNAPSLFVNTEMRAGNIPSDLPDIKSVTMDLCSNDYPTMDSAMIHIQKYILKYYQENHPEIFNNKRNLVDKAITGFQSVFSKNIFPGMKVRWSEYPNHIGHLEFNGCFRCHDGSHSTKTGETIRRDCTLCHLINAQGNPGKMEETDVNLALEFKHPVDIGEAWKESLCTDCHTGLNP